MKTIIKLTTISILINSFVNKDLLISKLTGVSKRLVLFVSIILSVGGYPNLLFSQDLAFKHYTKDDGLPSSKVSGFVQDTNGFIWIATDNGLCCFDGYDFKVYKHEDRDSASIPDNSISNIMYTDKCELIICTNKGIFKYHPKTDNFGFLLQNIKTEGAYQFQVDIFGNYYVKMGTYRLDIYSPEGERIDGFVNNKTNSKLEFSNIREVLCDSKGYTWIVDRAKGIYKLNVKDLSFKHFKYEGGKANTLASKKYLGLFEDKEKGEMWITGDPEISIINIENDSIRNVPRGNKPYSFRPGLYGSIVRDKFGNMWIAKGGGGAMQIDLGLNHYYYYNHNELDNTSLSDGSIYFLFPDTEGNIWMGGTNANVNVVINKYKNFKHLRRLAGASSTLAHNNIQYITEDANGVMWIATGNGLNRYDFRNNILETYRADRTNKNKSALPSNGVSFIKEHNGDILLSIAGSGIIKWNGKGNSFTTVVHQDKLPTESINFFDIDSKGNYWCTTNRYGIFKYDVESHKVTDFSVNAPKDSWRNFPGRYFRKFFIDKEDRIFCIGGGLRVIDEKEKKVKEFTLTTNDSMISVGKVICYHHENEEFFWLGTDAGLIKLDIQQDTMSFFGAEYGISNVKAILPDDEGNLWVSGTNGLVKFDPINLTKMSYNKLDGLQDNEFNNSCAYKGNDGYLNFGGVNGITRFHPKNIKVNPTPPKVQFTGIKLFNGYLKINPDGILKEDIKFQKELKFKYDENTLTIDYVGVNFYQTEKNQYMYFMEGLDKDWVIADKKRQANYTNIPPGKYTFYVKAANSDGFWGAPISKKITIVPPFWKTWLFRIVVFVLMVYAIFWFIKYRERAAHEQKQFLEQKVKEGEALITEKMEEVNKQQKMLRQRDIDEHDMRYMNQGLAKFGDIISKNKDTVKQLAQSTIAELVNYLKAEQGTIYVLENEEEQDTLRLQGIYNGAKNKIIQETFDINEGIIGACYKDAQVKIIDNLPEGYTEIVSGLGRGTPNTLIAVPIILDEIKEGVIEITSFKPIEQYKIDFLKKFVEPLASTINAVKKNEQIQKILISNQEDTEELRAQEEEMRQNMEEMQSIHDEMGTKQKELETIARISQEQEKELLKLQETIILKTEVSDEIIANLPFPATWKDTNLKYQACNEPFARLIGLKSTSDIRDKDDSELPQRKKNADALKINDMEVIKTLMEKFETIEFIDLTTNKPIEFNSTKKPLKNKKGQVIGILEYLEPTV
ncbi:hypothetical protein OAO55_03470 [Bacteroidales bacterium]|nr:hypothetical protein [Bacteroidales bacterium]